jgi:hypothetical protein
MKAKLTDINGAEIINFLNKTLFEDGMIQIT